MIDLQRELCPAFLTGLQISVSASTLAALPLLVALGPMRVGAEGVGPIARPDSEPREFSQIEGVESARAPLIAQGARVHDHYYQGGHEFRPWAAELGDALEWLLNRSAKLT